MVSVQSVIRWLRANGVDRIALGVIGFYCLTIAVLTFPFILHPATTYVGINGGDVTGSIATYEAIIHEKGNPFTTTEWHEVAAPYGAGANVGVNRVSFLSVLPLWLTSLAIGPLAAHALESITGYALTAIIAFVFVRRITGSWVGGAVAGFIFGFSPHMVAIARAAPAYTHMWLLLLPIMAFWSLLVRGPSRLRLALAALSVVPAIFWTPYFALHVLVVGAACLVVAGFLWLREGRGLRKAAMWTAVIAATWALGLFAFWYIGMHSPATHVPQRTLEEAYTEASHPLMYVLPGYYSNWGRGLHAWMSGVVPSTAGTNSYVGMSTVVLGVIAVLATWWWRNPKQKKAPQLATNEYGIRAAVLLSVFVVVACFLFSLAPTVHLGDITLPTPNYLVIKAVPALRAGQRFVMPMMGALAVLAGIGMYWLVRSSRSIQKALIIVSVPLIVFLDIATLPPTSATTVPVYGSMTTLSHQPKALTAQYYPGSSLFGPPGQFACILQIQHQQPIVNDCVLGRPDDNINKAPDYLVAIDVMPVCDQLSHLRSEFGVRYIIYGMQSYKVKECLKGMSTMQIAQDDKFTVVEFVDR